MNYNLARNRPSSGLIVDMLRFHRSSERRAFHSLDAISHPMPVLQVTRNRRQYLLYPIWLGRSRTRSYRDRIDRPRFVPKSQGNVGPSYLHSHISIGCISKHLSYLLRPKIAFASHIIHQSMVALQHIDHA